MIRESGGVPVLAHAAQLRTDNDAQLDRVVKDLVDLGLAGIEVLHSDHDARWIEKNHPPGRPVSACSKRAAAISTGGTRKTSIWAWPAGYRVPREWFDQLRAAVDLQHAAVAEHAYHPQPS